MHIHVPKPLHGWRAFMGEVGVIVLGVLIALTLEQLVETVHESKIAGEAREAVKAEVRENLWWLQRREQYEPCVRHRLAELNDLVARARRGASVPLVHYIGTLPHAKITSLRWEANSQAGRASLFSGDEQRVLGNMYYTTEQFREAQKEEEVVWAKMRFVQGLEQFAPLDVHDLSIFLAEARYQNWVLLLSIHRAHQWAKRMQLSAANPGSFEVANPRQSQICQKLTAPLVASDTFSGPDAFAEPGDTP
jgi:hypothetical protein